MKKKLSLILLTFILALPIFAFSVFGLDTMTVNCTGEKISVQTYDEFKKAVESYKSGTTISLSMDVISENPSGGAMIEVPGNGDLTVDLNGHSLRVNSSKDWCLFKLSSNSRIYFINSPSINSSGVETYTGGSIYFNSKNIDARLLYLSGERSKVININTNLTLGYNTAYRKTGSINPTYTVFIQKGAEFTSCGGSINNYMETGSSVYISSEVKNFELGIGGSTALLSSEYSIKFDPDKISLIQFGKCTMRQYVPENESAPPYPRLSVPADCTKKISDVFTVKSNFDRFSEGNTLVAKPASTKLSSLGNADITISKYCDTLNNSGTFVKLNYAGGHVFVCNSCGLNQTKITAHALTTNIAGIPASCTSEGKTAGAMCSKCAFTTAQTLPPTDHKMSFFEKTLPTCTEDGMNAHYECKNCKQCFADIKGTILLDREKLTVKTTHKTETRVQIDPSCKTDGKTVEVYCLTCKKTVSGGEIIPALGHDIISFGSEKAPTCTESGKNKGEKCNRCGEIIKAETTLPPLGHEIEVLPGKEASCTEKGLSAGERCIRCNIILTPQKELSPLGHKEYISKEEKAPTCTEYGNTREISCERCKKIIVESEITEKLSHKKIIVLPAVPASCEAEGRSEGEKCYYCGEILKEQTIYSPIGHNIKESGRIEPTCKNEGYTGGKYCTVCKKAFEGESIPKLPHEEKILEERKATCEKEGLSKGICCALCGEIIKKQEKTEKLPHNFSKKEVIKGSFTACGEIRESCESCKTQRVISKIGKVAYVSLSKNTFPYTGKTASPKAVLKDENGNLLKEGRDYTLKVNSEKNPGKYTVKVTLTGNYEGTKNLSYVILPGKTEKLLSKEETEKGLTLYWKAVKNASGYRVYLYNEKTKKYEAIKTLTGTSLKVSSLKKNSSYKFAVKAYIKIDGKVYWSKEYYAATFSTKLSLPSPSAISAKKSAKLTLKSDGYRDGFVIYMKSPKTGKYEKLGTAKTAFTVKNLESSKTYYFKVRAYKKVSGKTLYSDYSKAIKVKIK